MKLIRCAVGLALISAAALTTTVPAAAAARSSDTWSDAAAPVSVASAAGTVDVVSYDVTDTPQTGWGGWTHTYDGTITETGRTVSGSVFTGRGNYLADYIGGSGSLNDGLLGSNTHLFVTRNADDGLPIQPVITLHLAQRVSVESVTIQGGTSIFAGGIVSATIGVAKGVSALLPGTPTGNPGYFGVPVDDVFTLPGALAVIRTDTITLSGFTSTFYDQPFDQFTIDEVTVTPTTPVRTVDIDVQPGDSRSTINPRSAGVTPVAILSTAAFNASTEVDPSTVTFGRTGTESSIARWSITDVNRDRRPDLLLLAQTSALGFAGGESKALLRAQTFTGGLIAGSDQVKVLARR